MAVGFIISNVIQQVRQFAISNNFGASLLKPISTLKCIFDLDKKPIVIIYNFVYNSLKFQIV
jgi:hypothetical protein